MYRSGQAPEEMSCPRCGTALAVGRAGQMTAHGCGNCGGVWLDNAGTQRVVAGLSPEVVASFAAHTATASTRVDTTMVVTCPACGHPTVRKRIADASLSVDICNEHGTWFDRAEIEAIHAALHGAGQADKTPEIDPAALDMRTALQKVAPRLVATVDTLPKGYVEFDVGDAHVTIGEVNPDD